MYSSHWKLKENSTCHLITYSGHKISPVGQVQLTFTYRNQKHYILFQMVDGNNLWKIRDDEKKIWNKD